MLIVSSLSLLLFKLCLSSKCYVFYKNADSTIHLIKEQDIDISNLCVHPVCVSHIILVSSRAEGPHGRLGTREVQSILVNVCGRVVMFQLTLTENVHNIGNTSKLQVLIDNFSVL